MEPRSRARAARRPLEATPGLRRPSPNDRREPTSRIDQGSPSGRLIGDHRSESLPDHRFGAVYHLFDNAGGAHQSLGLTDRFTGQQAHLLEVARELRRWRKAAKPLHWKFLSIKTGLTNHRQLRIRNDLIGRRLVTPFPFLHDAVAQPASRSIGEFWTEDQMASRITDAGSDDAVLVLRMGIGLEAREEASPDPDRVGAERQRSSNGPAIGNATGSDDRHGRDCIDDCREQRECRRGGAVVAASLAALHDKPFGPALESGFRFVHAADLKPDVTAGRSQTRQPL